MRRASAVVLDGITAPTPASGQLVIFPSGGRLKTKDSAGTTLTAATCTVLPFSASGDLATGTGTYRVYNDSGVTWTILAVRASVGTAPTGAAVIVDVHKNGTTIFGTQANRPQIAVSTNTSKSTGMSVTTVSDGEYLTVDVDQIGSTIKGANLTVQITVV